MTTNIVNMFPAVKVTGLRILDDNTGAYCMTRQEDKIRSYVGSLVPSSILHHTVDIFSTS